MGRRKIKRINDYLISIKGGIIEGFKTHPPDKGE